MLKELKYLFYIIFIFLVIFLTLEYYFSDSNKKKFYRSLNKIDKKILNYSNNLILLDSNTDNNVEYVERTVDKNKKDYSFWELINKNE